MAATARVTVLFDPAEKATLQAHAAAAHVSAGEYIKRAVLAYDADLMPDPATMAELEAMADSLQAAAAKMGAQLDASIAKIDYALDPAREVEIRERVEREIAGLDLSGVAALLGMRH